MWGVMSVPSYLALAHLGKPSREAVSAYHASALSNHIRISHVVCCFIVIYVQVGIVRITHTFSASGQETYRQSVELSSLVCLTGLTSLFRRTD